MRKLYFFLTFNLVCFLSFTIPVFADPAPVASSPEGNWTVDQYRNSTGMLISPLVDSPIIANFSDDNLTGSSGCNQYMTHYTTSGGAMIIIQPTSTRMSCLPDVMAQEQAYFAAFKNVALVQGNETHLVLYDDDEEELISFVPVR